MQLPAKFRLGQRPALDGLRGLAVLAVLLTHLHLIPGGVVGVEVLLTLSGFLITIMLLEEHDRRGGVSLKSFYRKRFLRVLPPLVALVVIGSAISITIGYRQPLAMLGESLVAFALLGNAQQALQVHMPVFGHTWTLALEVQFYLLWPVALYFLLRAKVSRQRIVMLLAAAVVAAMAWRIALFLQRPPSGPARQQFLMRLFMGLDTHVDTLLIGCLLGALLAGRRLPVPDVHRRRLRVAGAVAVCGLLFLLLYCHHEQYAFYCGLFTLTGIMTAALIASVVLDPPPVLTRVLEFRVFVGLGRISYALYLFHMPIFQWLEPQSPGLVALALVLSFASAIASFYVLERRFIRAKNRVAVAPVPLAKAA